MTSATHSSIDRTTANPPPRCWGIGLSRTGTTSFCEALRILGYANVKHNPEYPELKDLDGGSDLGVIVFYKYLDFKFPGSKFVLMLRQDQEAWLKSVEYILGVFPVRFRTDDTAIMRRMAVFETVRFEREKFVSAYQRHLHDVRRYFANRPEDLLEIDLTAGEGWQKLCPFLDLPIPDAAFPHRNAQPPPTPSTEAASAKP